MFKTWGYKMSKFRSLGFRVQGLGFGVLGSGLYSLGLRITEGPGNSA